MVRVRRADGVVSIGKAVSGQLGLELGPNSPWCSGICEQDGPEGDVVRARGEQLERVPPGRYSAHADDRQLGGPPARVDRGERDRTEGWAREPAGTSGKRR